MNAAQSIVANIRTTHICARFYMRRIGTSKVVNFDYWDEQLSAHLGSSCNAERPGALGAVIVHVVERNARHRRRR